jgi:hypothetical protein
VKAIVAAGQQEDVRIFDHPRCFEALKALLASLPELAHSPGQNISLLLISQGLNPAVAEQSQKALETLGVQAALAHCQRQSTSSAQFQRQFHQWFDAFRTLKFVHAIRDAGWPQQSLTQLSSHLPRHWPTATASPHTFDLLRTNALRQNQD